MFKMIQAALWGTDPGEVSQLVFDELKIHSIAVLPANLIGKMNLPSHLRNEWKNLILQQLCYYSDYIQVQSSLPINVPYTILKGTAAAKYYPYPEYRTMGDIDIMTRREDYDLVCDMLLKNGFVETTSDKTSEFGRHRGFIKNNIEIEVHAFFALLNNPEAAEYMDDLIIENINPSHELPDVVNGLVLLEHIDQHLEDGLGLRQIIDWMMFVDKCLSEDEWPVFQVLAQKIGLEKLAIVVTRMCEIYLGLSEHKWCANAQKHLCDQLMEYVLSCGNFGKKRTGGTEIGAGVLVSASSPKAAFGLLQKRGLEHWEAARSHKCLRPFAWVYQLVRYILKGLGREKASDSLKKDYIVARKRKKLFSSLGVTQVAKGLAIYENGKFKKSYKIP